MAGTTEYKNKWMQENRERINLVVPKGFKEQLRAAAEAKGESVTGFIMHAVEERLKRPASPAERVAGREEAQRSE